MVDEQWPTRVDGTIFGAIEWVHTVDSTNTVLMAAAANGAGEGRVLVADHQTAGRGRRGRQWMAPPGSSLMMSVLLRPPMGSIPPAEASLVTSAFAVAAVEAVSELCAVRLTVKWPNDLVVVADDLEGPGYRKVAGILTESVVSDGDITALVVGMGMNTSWGSMPPDLTDRAVSLDQLAGRAVSRPMLLSGLLRHFDANYRCLLAAGGRGAILERAQTVSATIGNRVSVDLGGGDILMGMASGLGSGGELIVRDGDGRRHTVSAGEVIRLRPAPAV